MIADDTPPEQLAALASDPRAGARREVARHPAAAPELLARLALDENFWVRTDAAAHPAFPQALRERLRRAGATADLAGFGAPDPSLAAEVLAELAAAGPWGERLAARHPATSPEVLGRLADLPGALLRAEVARHPRTAPEMLARLLEDAEAAVRQAAAGHPGVPAEALDLLRRAGAGALLDGSGPAQGELSPEECRRLARGGPFARRLAARQPALPGNELARLAADLEPEVRLEVAQNEGCPAGALVDLAADADPRVARAVARHPAAPGEALERLAAEAEGDVEVLVALAAHPRSPPKLLARLAEHGAFRVREQVAEHPSFPAAHRRLLARAGSSPDLVTFAEPDPELPARELDGLARGGAWARRLAARHPATPGSDLARLVADSDLAVRMEAAGNSATPRQIVDLLARAEVSGPTPLSAAEVLRLAGLGPWGRRLAARLPQAPASLLADLAQDSDPEVRAAVAAHPAAAPATLLALAQDSAAGVRWAVARRAEPGAEALPVLARDPLPAIRAAVARHPRSGEALLRALALDLDEEVREAARRTAGESAAGDLPSACLTSEPLLAPDGHVGLGGSDLLGSPDGDIAHPVSPTTEGGRP